MICGQGTAYGREAFSRIRHWYPGCTRLDVWAPSSRWRRRSEPKGGHLGGGEGALDSELKSCKRTLRILLRTVCSAERLDSLLAHSRSGQVDIHSCCHFLGGIARQHAPLGKSTSRPFSKVHHYRRALVLEAAQEAEWALYRLGFIRRPWEFTSDELRGRRLAPMVRAEIRRRSRPQTLPKVVWSRSWRKDRLAFRSTRPA